MSGDAWDWRRNPWNPEKAAQRLLEILKELNAEAEQPERARR